MNVLIDTNILLDDILRRDPNAETAKKITQLVVEQRVIGHITANTITDIFYIVSKNCDKAIAREVVKNLLETFVVISVSGQDCIAALGLPLSDFEDALVVVCASNAYLENIVTNDKVFLKQEGLSVPAISPTDFLLKFERYS